MKTGNALRSKSGILLGILLLMLSIAALGCNVAATTSSSEGEDTASESTDEATEGTEATDGINEECRALAAPQVSGAKDADRKTAVLETSKGTIKFTFHPDEAPLHVASFLQLAECGLYNGVTFHRIGPEDPRAPEMAQVGDPLSRILEPGDPRIGTGGAPYSVPAEFSDLPHLEGTVAMARGPHPDSAGSQFYIAKTALPGLDGQYTVFGQVTEGIEVVKALKIGDVLNSVTIQETP